MGMMSGCKVLVVDDNLDVADSMADVIEVMGHSVRVERTGLGAIAAVIEQGWGPDLILCDIGLPDINGFEVAQRLKATEVPLFAMTGHFVPYFDSVAEESGFEGYLMKPVDLNLLERLLHGVAQRHE